MTASFDFGVATFADAEAYVVDMLKVACAKVTPAPYVGTWFPPDYEKRLKAAPMVICQRVGGVAAGAAAIIDEAVVEIGVLAYQRATAWQLLGGIRAWLLSGQLDKDQFSAVGQVEEVEGPVQKVWDNPDVRWVSHVFKIPIRRSRG